jgi:hypothetical protein
LFSSLIFEGQQPGSVLVLSPTFSVWRQFTVCAGKEKWTPERNAIGHTHDSASSEQACEPMPSSSVNFCRKTRTVPTKRGGFRFTLCTSSCGCNQRVNGWRGGGVAGLMEGRWPSTMFWLDRIPRSAKSFWLVRCKVVVIFSVSRGGEMWWWGRCPSARREGDEGRTSIPLHPFLALLRPVA